MATIAHPSHFTSGVCAQFVAQAKVAPVNTTVAVTKLPKMTPSGILSKLFHRKDGTLRMAAVVICYVLSVCFFFLLSG
jgi:hypothetical protein